MGTSVGKACWEGVLGKLQALWYTFLMTREDITAVLDRVRTWPKERQEDLVRIALQIEAQDRHVEPEDDATRAAIAEGLAQARRGEFVPDQEMAAFFKSHGL